MATLYMINDAELELRSHQKSEKKEIYTLSHIVMTTYVKNDINFTHSKKEVEEQESGTKKGKTEIKRKQ